MCRCPTPPVAPTTAGDPMLSTFANAALFQVAWFVCVWGAAQGRPAVAVTGSALAVAWHLVQSPRRVRALAVVVAGASAGLFADTVLVRVGLLAFPTEAEASWSPPWMVALWAAFATTVGESLAWLSRRPIPAALLGAIAGPLSYGAGARLGAIELSGELVVTAIGIGLAWALALPALGALERRLVRGTEQQVRGHRAADEGSAPRDLREAIGLE